MMVPRAVKQVSLITDGSCVGNPGPGGWACILRFGTVKKELFGCDSDTTNNRMELMAAIQGLLAFKEPCDVWTCLLPVVANESVGDILGRDFEQRAGVGTVLDRQVREREQQRKLVGRREGALIKQALQLYQESDLVV